MKNKRMQEIAQQYKEFQEKLSEIFAVIAEQFAKIAKALKAALGKLRNLDETLKSSKDKGCCDQGATNSNNGSANLDINAPGIPIIGPKSLGYKGPKSLGVDGAGAVGGTGAGMGNPFAGAAAQMGAMGAVGPMGQMGR